MERSHRRIATRLWQAVSRSDAASIHDLLAPDVVWHTRTGGGPGETIQGPEAVLDLLARGGELVEDLRLRLRDVFASSRGAILHYDMAASRGPLRLDTQVLIVLRIEGSRILEMTAVPLEPREDEAFWRLQ